MTALLIITIVALSLGGLASLVLFFVALDEGELGPAGAGLACLSMFALAIVACSLSLGYV